MSARLRLDHTASTISAPRGGLIARHAARVDRRRAARVVEDLVSIGASGTLTLHQGNHRHVHVILTADASHPDAQLTFLPRLRGNLMDVAVPTGPSLSWALVELVVGDPWATRGRLVRNIAAAAAPQVWARHLDWLGRPDRVTVSAVDVLDEIRQYVVHLEFDAGRLAVIVREDGTVGSWAYRDHTGAWLPGQDGNGRVLWTLLGEVLGTDPESVVCAVVNDATVNARLLLGLPADDLTDHA